METQLSPTTHLQVPVDNEHGALRLVILFVFLVAGILGFMLGIRLFPGTEVNFLAIVTALLVGGGISAIIERYLKRIWPSGRSLEFTNTHIRLNKRNKPEVELDPEKQINVLLWRFTVKRRGRVPKGWHVFSIALEQDEQYIPIYAIVSPKRYETLSNIEQFTRLIGDQELKSSGAERDLRLAGQQRRLRIAEAQRWVYGAEISVDELFHIIAHLRDQFPKWMPS